MEEIKEKKKADYKLVEVPTQYGLAVQNPTGEAISMEQALVECLNLLKAIHKNTV